MVKDINLDDLKILTEDKESYIKQAGIPEKNLFTADNANEIKNKHNALVEYATGFPTEEQIGEITKQVVASLSDDIKELLNSKEQVYDGTIGDFETKSNLINYLVENVDKVVDLDLGDVILDGIEEIAGQDTTKTIRVLTNGLIFKRCFLDKSNKFLVFNFISSNAFYKKEGGSITFSNLTGPIQLCLCVDIENNYARYIFIDSGNNISPNKTITIDNHNNSILFDENWGHIDWTVRQGKDINLAFETYPKKYKSVDESNYIKIKYKNVKEIVD